MCSHCPSSKIKSICHVEMLRFLKDYFCCHYLQIPDARSGERHGEDGNGEWNQDVRDSGKGNRDGGR